MTKSCPIPTPAERRCGEILKAAKEEMMRTVHAALDEAETRVRAQIGRAGFAIEAPPRAYFATVVHQQMYCMLCGADPATFAGGNPDIAKRIIRNSQDIARHYWGATPEPSV